MGKKHGKGKKKTVISLAEFNESAGLGGVDPALSALPSAPKAAEEWEAEGGRPEYNSRGYKERPTNRERDYDNDTEFEDRSWARKGPLEDQERGNGFGMGGSDRDWGDMRRGPMDTPETNERNWGDMRRGPVDSAFEGTQERDWGVRKGPIEADSGNAPRVISDDNWSSARKTTVEADFPEQQQGRDWAVRKGPVEAQGVVAEVDWSARKGPVESEFPQAQAERDWSQRKGPVEADLPAKQADPNWDDVRKDSSQLAEEEKPEDSQRDWSARKGPVDAEVTTAQKGIRDIDFGDIRRGARLQEMEKPRTMALKDTDAPKGQGIGKDSWRRDAGGLAARRDRPLRERPASTGHDSGVQDRDWGAARRTQPLKERETRSNRVNGNRVSDVSESSDTSQADADTNAQDGDGDDWTTVRSGTQKRTSVNTNRRYSARDEPRGNMRRGGREPKGARFMRAPLESQNKATSSPVTPVASAGPES